MLCSHFTLLADLTIYSFYYIMCSYHYFFFLIFAFKSFYTLSDKSFKVSLYLLIIFFVVVGFLFISSFSLFYLHFYEIVYSHFYDFLLLYFTFCKFLIYFSFSVWFLAFLNFLLLLLSPSTSIFITLIVF